MNNATRWGTIPLALTTIATLQSAQAFDPPYVWVGRAIIENMTAPCDEWEAFRVGTEFDSVFRPRIRNGESTLSISFARDGGGMSLYRSDEPGLYRQLPKGKYSALHIKRRADTPAGKSQGTYYLKIINPVSGKSGFTETTTELTIDPIVISNWGDKQGCTVTLRGAYTLQGRV